MSDGRYVMGTVLEIKLVVDDAERGRRILAELFELAERLDGLLSVYDPDSEVSRLNRAAGAGRLAVDPEVVRVLSLSKHYWRLTGGSFDVTVGPLVELWTMAARRNAAPTPEELAAARAFVGSDRVLLHQDGTAELAQPGVEVNLGGVAKGYALDRMLPVIEEHGVARALLNFGLSSVWALGRPADAPAWRLLAEGPGQSYLGFLNLEGRALSVSGSLGQWVEIGGRRYGHVFDPRTGRALSQRRQALVVAPDATLAEALSKALLVLGERDGLALVHEQPGCAALLVDADGGVWRTPDWDALAGFEGL